MSIFSKCLITFEATVWKRFCILIIIGPTFGLPIDVIISIYEDGKRETAGILPSISLDFNFAGAFGLYEYVSGMRKEFQYPLKAVNRSMVQGFSVRRTLCRELCFILSVYRSLFGTRLQLTFTTDYSSSYTGFRLQYRIVSTSGIYTVLLLFVALLFHSYFALLSRSGKVE